MLAGCASGPAVAPPIVRPTPPPPAPNLRDPRFAATATLLANGKVLIAGGAAKEEAASSVAEIYDPSADGFTLAGGMLSGRAYHTATLLNDGRVLIVGGVGTNGHPVRAAEIYDPAKNQFQPTGNLIQARYDHTATLLRNGKVLITGGDATTATVTNIDTAELYDPATGSFSPTGNVTRVYDPAQNKFFHLGKMHSARAKHTATLLSDGRVLIAGGGDVGGKSLATAEIYDPKSGRFSVVASMTTSRQMATASRLHNGQVLITGGVDAGGNVLATAELYNPTRHHFTPVTTIFPRGTNMTDERQQHTATVLPNGMVLIAGGGNERYSLASAELYNPVNGAFACVGGRSAGPHTLCAKSMNEYREGASAVLIGNGTVLIAAGYNFGLAPTAGDAGSGAGGGNAPFNLLQTAEFYNPASGTFVFIDLGVDRALSPRHEITG